MFAIGGAGQSKKPCSASQGLNITLTKWQCMTGLESALGRWLLKFPLSLYSPFHGSTKERLELHSTKSRFGIKVPSVFLTPHERRLLKSEWINHERSD